MVTPRSSLSTLAFCLLALISLSNAQSCQDDPTGIIYKSGGYSTVTLDPMMSNDDDTWAAIRISWSSNPSSDTGLTLMNNPTTEFNGDGDGVMLYVRRETSTTANVYKVSDGTAYNGSPMDVDPATLTSSTTELVGTWMIDDDEDIVFRVGWGPDSSPSESAEIRVTQGFVYSSTGTGLVDMGPTLTSGPSSITGYSVDVSLNLDDNTVLDCTTSSFPSLTGFIPLIAGGVLALCIPLAVICMMYKGSSQEQKPIQYNGRMEWGG